MNISAKTEYACIAILELAANYGSGEPVRVRQIAETHGIPSRFLVQILLQLKGAGLVNSTRGASGGYQLICDPANVSLSDVMSVIDGQSNQTERSNDAETPISRVLHEAWTRVNEVQREMLEEMTLSELVERVNGQTQQMYYI